MNIKESIKILGQAAGELSAFIACHNLSMKHKISATDLDEPDYMDMQTCHELQVIAKEMESWPEWISIKDEMPEVGQETLIRIPVCGRFNIENGKYKGDGSWVGAWCDRRGSGAHYQVTHWVPLPEPPNKQGG